MDPRLVKDGRISAQCRDTDPGCIHGCVAASERSTESTRVGAECIWASQWFCRTRAGTSWFWELGGFRIALDGHGRQRACDRDDDTDLSR